MSEVIDADHPTVFRHQPDIFVNTALPVINTWYTALAATSNVRLIGIYIYVATANESVEMRITVDGVVIDPTAGVAINFGAWYSGHLTSGQDELNIIACATVEPTTYRAFMLEGKNVRVEYRKTTANGANPLYCMVKYARRV